MARKMAKIKIFWHLEFFNFWLRFLRNLFETKTMFLVMVQHIFYNYISKSLR